MRVIPRSVSAILVIAVSWQLAEAQPAVRRGARAIAHLSDVMDRFHKTLDVYTDSHAAGNHFAVRARMSSAGDEDAVPTMNEAWSVDPHSGIDAIEARFVSKGLNWGGWYFMNGVLEGSERRPRPNWGDVPGAGLDLRGATKLEWWARGRDGGERIRFFASGVGRDPRNGQPTAKFPDSSETISRTVTLSKTWQRFELVLPKGGLGYVLGGFGWTASAPDNGNRDLTFYIDDARYDKARLDEPRFLVSYETIRSTNDFDVVMRNVGYSYDNAVTLIALLAAGERDRARLIAEAFVQAQRRDPVYRDRRLRNAYQGGSLLVPPGWRPNNTADAVRLPGWYDQKTQAWLEDSQQISTNTGNMARILLALTAYAEATGDLRTRQTAEDLGEWIEEHCRDGRGDGGYRAGFERWPDDLLRLDYKATEHAIDLYAAFRRLHRLTKAEKWRARAEHARRFLVSMWDPDQGRFLTGTENDGVTKNRDVIPLDVQAWAVLALWNEDKTFERALANADKSLRVGQGYDFNQDLDGVWFEGSAQMAAAYGFVGNQKRRDEILARLQMAQLPSGALPAASRDGLTTGFNLPDGKPWLYFNRPHIAATAWAAIAQMGVNPFE